MAGMAVAGQTWIRWARRRQLMRSLQKIHGTKARHMEGSSALGQQQASVGKVYLLVVSSRAYGRRVGLNAGNVATLL